MACGYGGELPQHQFPICSGLSCAEPSFCRRKLVTSMVRAGETPAKAEQKQLPNPALPYPPMGRVLTVG